MSNIQDNQTAKKKRIYLSLLTMHDLEMKYIQEAFDSN